MKHIFKQGTNSEKPVLLMLHGTGGTEEDLLPIAEMIDPTASVLSVRGNVLEQGMPRFFKRLREGIFDLEDLAIRTKELNDFLGEAAEKYAFNRENIVAIGYSNGANIAGSLLFHYEQSLKGAILFHPMVPRRDIEVPNAQGVPIFIGAGINDPICPADETKELTTLLQGAQATVDVHWESFGHQLTRTEVEAAKTWYERIYGNK
ncbi:alpha/beta hydrolase [Priestia flexa]|uniref:alpha/beta hydrolase n=1 Tax=Priestia flexa TaxID=86664 RepID=UPI001B31D3CD|nr:alpha/beta hydrolase [Priestia flexa]